MFSVVGEGFSFYGLPEARCSVGLVPSLTTQRGFGHFHFVRHDMKTIPLTRGMVALVDDEDFEDLSQYQWQASTGRYCSYAVRDIYKNGSHWRERMHRRIMNAREGNCVDHKNHNGLDNRRDNLRICSPSQNLQNMRNSKGGSSQYKGVSWSRAAHKWKVAVQHNGEQIHLGVFCDEKEAARVYDEEAQKLFGEFAFLNFGTRE
jgi:hypothetical protein